jgi:UDPglucose 6-dehydrogenase
LKIAIIGSGVVGQGTGCGLSQLGHDVIYYDVSKDKLEMLQDKGEKVAFSITEAILSTDLCFICVPTPYNDGIDLSYLKYAVNEITRVLKSRQLWYLVVVKSTVISLTCENVVLPILKEAKINFGLCMNPEFLTEINTSWTDDTRFKRDFWCKERIVIGELDKKSGDVLEEIYKPIGAPIYRTDLKTAEMCKYAANCMLATKISYWNEIGEICKKLDINSNLVAEITSKDARIGIYGTKHGLAYGGSCLPKDTKALCKAFIEDEDGYISSPSVLAEVIAVNDMMKDIYGERK